ncbi:MAG: hypothetical protein HKN79_09825, partial [Flavobacteriales bacterium]|nr:hypothetical protein [Flavobacteriales bacterium]
IDNCTFDVRRSGINYDVEIQGDWNNISGRFTPRTSNVTFSGSGTIFNYTGEEGFYDVDFSGTPQLVSDITVSNEVYVSNYLDANDNDVYVEKDWVCTGDYVGNGGTVIFEGANISTVSGTTDFDNVTIDKDSGIEVDVTGTMNIYGTLLMDNGELTTNDNVVIASNATATGRLGVMGLATFNGDLQVDRYMNPPGNEWHLIGSSVTGMSIADWNDDFITTGFTGSDWPTFGFCSITRYDETQLGHKDIGVYNVTSTADAIPTGEGVRAYIAQGPHTLSVAGPPVTGAFAWSLTYTNSGSAVDDGWNLVSNPYPSTIDWDDTPNWVRTGVKDAIYVWVSEHAQFSSYIAGVGTNGGTQYIPSSQAFWVQTDTPLPVMSIVEGAKSNVDETFRNYEDISFFKVQMTTSNGKTDEAAIRLDGEATMEFDSDLDAYELRSTNANYPSVGLLTADGVNASIYSFATLDEETMIPMSIYVGVQGDVEFNTEGFSGFAAGLTVKIYDSLNDEYHQIRDVATTTLTLDAGEYENRFYLVITPRLNFENVRDISQESQYDVWADDSNLFIRGTDSSGSVDIEVYNAVGQRIFSEQNVNMGRLYSTSIALQNGLMIVDIIDRDSGQRSTKRLIR